MTVYTHDVPTFDRCRAAAALVRRTILGQTIDTHVLPKISLQRRHASEIDRLLLLLLSALQVVWTSDSTGSHRGGITSLRRTLLVPGEVSMVA